jgi:epoxide hydrolase-like predicted phosphatase
VPEGEATVPDLAGLLIDFAGVLTTPVTRSFRAFCREEGLPSEIVKEVFVAAYRSADGEEGPVAALEKGRMTPEEFGVRLCADLTARTGVALDGERFVERIFAGIALDEEMLAAVEALRRAGYATCLLSNSWGEGGYPRDRFPALFDAVVISGEVGMRKPDAEIFLHAARQLGLPPQRCAFVDDLDANVHAAQRLGITGVVHTRTPETIAELAALFSVPRELLAS